MVFPKARVAVAALLFLGWLGFLAFLAFVARDPVVLSRPQILVANLCVVAKIDEQDGRPSPNVKVTEVLWAADDATPLVDQTLTLDELPEIAGAQGWAGPGVYLLPLTKLRLAKDVRYFLTKLPPMPGFYPTFAVELLETGKAPVKVAERIHEGLGIDRKMAEELVNKSPILLKRFVPREAAIGLKIELDKFGAIVQLREHETRVYRATEDVLRQFRELKPNQN